MIILILSPTSLFRIKLNTRRKIIKRKKPISNSDLTIIKLYTYNGICLLTKFDYCFNVKIMLSLEQFVSSLGIAYNTLDKCGATPFAGLYNSHPRTTRAASSIVD